MNDPEKMALLKREMEKWMLDESNKRGKVIDLMELSRISKVNYSTLAPIARGERLPNWKNSVLLIRARPAIGKILEFPDILLPDDPVIRRAVELAQDSPEWREILEYLMEYPEDWQKFKEFMTGVRTLTR